MLDFDQAREQRESEFKIGGEVFTIRPVRPEVLIEHQEMSGKPEELMPKLDAFILECILDGDNGNKGAHERFRAVRERVTDPLTLGDMQSLMQGLVEWQSASIEATTGRPTGPSSTSTRGRGATGTSSTDDSSSPAAKAVRVR